LFTKTESGTILKLLEIILAKRVSISDKEKVLSFTPDVNSGHEALSHAATCLA
jgi:hypothetical protein